jgi:hypothetical protein
MQVTLWQKSSMKKRDNDSYECIYDLVTVDGFIEGIS